MRALAVSAERTVEGVEEEVTLRMVRSKEERLAVVREFEAGPVWFGTLNLRGSEVGPHVKGCEGRFVVVS